MASNDGIKIQLVGLEKELNMMEKKFSKAVKKRDRRYSNAYVKNVAKAAFLYGKLSTLREMEKSNDHNDSSIDYIG
jgi:hypothetical protein